MLITPSRVMDPACLEQRSGCNRGMGACDDLVRICPHRVCSDIVSVYIMARTRAPVRAITNNSAPTTDNSASTYAVRQGAACFGRTRANVAEGPQVRSRRKLQAVQRGVFTSAGHNLSLAITLSAAPASNKCAVAQLNVPQIISCVSGF